MARITEVDRSWSTALKSQSIPLAAAYASTHLGPQEFGQRNLPTHVYKTRYE